MSPGTLGGRVAAATPMSVDLTRLAPRLRTSPLPPTGSGPASMSRISAANFAAAALTTGVWHQLVFDATEEVVGSDLFLDTSTGTITVNADGIYSIGAQLMMHSAPAGSWCTLDIAVSGTHLDAYIRNGQVLSSPWDSSDKVSDHFPPYFIGAGNTIKVFAAVGYSSGGAVAPDFTTVWVQRIV